MLIGIEPGSHEVGMGLMSLGLCTRNGNEAKRFLSAILKKHIYASSGSE